MRRYLTFMMSSIVILVVSLSTAANVRAQEAGRTVSCVLRHSAVAGLDESGSIDTHTTDNDSIEAVIEGVGRKEAILNGQHELIRLKEDDHACYYLQPTIAGFSTWVYFKSSNTIIFSKLRAFPLDGRPDSYMMIARCE